MGKLEDLIQRIEDPELREEILVELKRRGYEDPGKKAGELFNRFLKNSFKSWEERAKSTRTRFRDMIPIQPFPDEAAPVYYIHDSVEVEVSREEDVVEQEDGEETS